MAPIPPLPRLQSEDPIFNRFQDGLHQVLRQVTAPEAWHAPALLNSWVNYDTAHQQAGYMKDAQGFVHLRGLVKSGTIGVAIFTLPIGYRPSGSMALAIASNQLFGVCDVNSSGDVVPAVGSNVYFSLDGITFDTR